MSRLLCECNCISKSSFFIWLYARPGGVLASPLQQILQTTVKVSYCNDKQNVYYIPSFLFRVNKHVAIPTTATTAHLDCMPTCLRYYMIFRPYNTSPAKSRKVKSNTQFVSVKPDNKEITSDIDSIFPL